MTELELLHDDGTPFVVSAGQAQADGSTRWLNTVFTARAKAAKYAARQNRAGYDVYVKHGLFDGATKANGSPICTTEHSLGSRTLAVDVDAGADKPYPTIQDALQALYHAVSSAQAECGLPPYNLLLDTGHGIHAAWVLDVVLKPGRWASSTATLYKLLERLGLKPDRGMRAIDKALRLGGMTNYKAPSAPTALMHHAERIPLPQMEKALGPERLTLVQPDKVRDERDEAFDIPSSYRFSIDEVVDECLVLKHMRDTGGVDVDNYDFWHRVVQQAARDSDTDRGDYWAHKFSEAHAKYNPREVDDKVVDARKSQRLITCQEFASHTKICQSCPWWGKVKSAGGIPKQKRLEVSTTFALPDPRYVNGPYSLLLQYQDEDGKLQEITVLRSYNFGLVELFEDETGQETLEFVYFPFGQAKRQRKVSLKVPEFRSVTTMVDSLAKFQLLVSPSSHKRFLEALMDWLTALRAQNRAKRNHTRLGWTEDGSFVTGGTMHGAAASTAFASRGYMAAYEPSGNLGSFMGLAHTILDHELRPAAHMLVSVAFAAPLLSLAGVAGSTLCFWSSESGLGKSTLMALAAAVWGRPLRTIATTSDTINAVVHKAGILRSMPWLFDDMTATTIKTHFEMFLRQATSGREKDRLGSMISLEGGGDWQTLFCLAANVSVSSVLVQNNKIDQAMNARYLDIEVPPLRSNTVDRIAVNRAKSELERQYGLLGPGYAKLLVDRQDPLKASLDKTSSFLQNNLGLHNDAFARFHIATAACLIIGAKLAKNSLGFPVQPNLVQHGVIEALKESGTLRQQMGLDVDPSHLLRKFLNQYVNARLITESSGNASRPNVLIKEHPVPRETVVYEIDLAKRVIVIDAKSFHRFVGAEMQNQREVLDKLTRAYSITRNLRALGPRTKFGTSTMEVLQLHVPNQGGPWSEYFA